jgi:hypothetical protein
MDFSGTSIAVGVKDISLGQGAQAWPGAVYISQGESNFQHDPAQYSVVNKDLAGCPR